MSAEDTRRRKPVFGAVGIACAVLALPLARLAADVLVTREDLLGYYGLWTGLLVFLIVMTVGIVSTGWSLLRKETPGWVPILAAISNLGLIGALLIFLA